MPVRFTADDVKAIAALAQLDLTPGEIDLFARQLSDFLGYATEVLAVDTAGVAPTAYLGSAPTSHRLDDARRGGVRVALKNSPCAGGLRRGASWKLREHYEPPSDAPVAARLENAGAIVVGKTNCDEFAMGSSTENSAFGPTRNPWALDRIPGGTSGGSAAAVAARLTPLALGSDTGGSIRQPAALCGVVGLKPTYGRVSRYGLIAHASSLDQVGPLTRTVHDAALALEVLAGIDPADATSAAAPVPS